LGGGRANSISILEAVTRFEMLMGKKLKTAYVEKNRIGDHICYISSIKRIQKDYPKWRVEKSIDQIFEDIACAK
jgi:CDP-paratose 2-epimerase